MMKHIPIIFVIIPFLYIGCSPIYYVAHRVEVDSNTIAIEELTHLLETQPLDFLARVKLDTERLGYSVDSLGFGYVFESGAYRYNDQIYFWIKSIRFADSVISYSADPFYWKIGPDGAELYTHIYKYMGWQPKSWNKVVPKFYNYEFSTKPVGEHLTIRRENNLTFEPLMSPYTGHIFVSVSRPEPDGLHSAFEAISPYLTDDDIYYLLHSLNPATRVITIRHVLCNSITISLETRARVEYLLASSPKVPTLYGDLRFKSDLKSLIECNH